MLRKDLGHLEINPLYINAKVLMLECLVDIIYFKKSQPIVLIGGQTTLHGVPHFAQSLRMNNCSLFFVLNKNILSFLGQKWQQHC